MTWGWCVSNVGKVGFEPSVKYRIWAHSLEVTSSIPGFEPSVSYINFKGNSAIEEKVCCNSMLSVGDSNPKGFNTPPLTTNELSYASDGIASKAQHLRAFLLFAIDFLSIKTPRFSLIFLLYMPLSWKTPYLEKRSTELLVMWNQGFGNWPVRTSLCLSLSTSELAQNIIGSFNNKLCFVCFLALIPRHRVFWEAKSLFELVRQFLLLFFDAISGVLILPWDAD